MIFRGPDSGWVVGDKGVILKTTNAGVNWFEQESGTNYDLNEIYAENTSNAWIVGDEATFLMTTDGGENWNVIDVSDQTSVDLHGLHVGFQSRKAVGTGGNYFESQDGSPYWTRVNTGINGTFRSCQMILKPIGIVVGDNGTILLLRTNDTTSVPVFVDKSIDSNYDLKEIIFNTRDCAYIVGTQGVFIISENVGWTYEIRAHLPAAVLNTVFFNTKDLGFVAGSGGSVFRTTDRGFNWTRSETGVRNMITDSYFIDSDTGYVVGYGGMILKTTNAGGLPKPTGIDCDLQLMPEEYELSQNYPNPFNPSTTINFVLPEAAAVHLSVFNTLGEEVAVLVDEFRSAGKYSIAFSAANLPSGIYYYSLRANGFLTTKKMILLK
jgi:photosystem II stability/assembly factor-like uncharacterized protein